MREARAAVFLVTMALLFQSCGQEDHATYVVQVRVTTDAGDPVVGAHLRVEGGDDALSDATGHQHFEIEAADGQRRSLTVVCPTGYRQPAEPVPFLLRQVTGVDGSLSRTTHVATECIPLKRQGVLVVRARGAGALPVIVDGQVVGRTSEAGVAHVALDLIPGSELRATLDTSASPRIVPASPTQRFVLEDRDSILAFDVVFDASAPKRPRRRKSQDRPYRID